MEVVVEGGLCQSVVVVVVERSICVGEVIMSRWRSRRDPFNQLILLQCSCRVGLHVAE